MLELSNLTRRYDGFAFGPVDLSVGDEVLSVLGPSGSGKTTFLSLIAGIVDPDAGTISLDGQSLVGRSLEERKTGIVFQHGALFPHMTARENVAYAATDRSRIDELADLLEVRDVLDRRPPTLSGGEKQRVALARTLAADPDALLLDEPLSSLDAPIRRRLRDELHRMFASLDIPVIYVTHDQRTATALGDRIAIIRDGGLEQVGPPEDVLKRPESRFVARFTGNENLFDATVTARDGENVTVRIEDLTLRSSADAPVGSSVTACVHPSRVRLDAEALRDGSGRDGPTREENVLAGTVDRWLNEGDEYRVSVDVDAASTSLSVAVPPHTFERLSVEQSSSVRVAVPADAVHLVP